MGACSHQFGCSWSRMRGYTTPPYMFLLPGNGPRSSRTTERPARASTVAAHEPAGPAPTTTTSTIGGPRVVGHAEQGSQLVEDRVRIRHHGEVGHLHHRAVWI